MALDLAEIGGDKSQTHDHVKALLHAAYDEALGIHEVALHYTSGRGYRVVRATKRTVPGGAYKPGDKFKTEPVAKDIAEDVRALLRKGDVQLHE